MNDVSDLEIETLDGGNRVTNWCIVGTTVAGGAFGAYFGGVPGLALGALVGQALGQDLCA